MRKPSAKAGLRKQRLIIRGLILHILWQNRIVRVHEFDYTWTRAIKYRAYTGTLANHYFWRTYDQQEIDLVEEREGHLFGYEFKWSAAANPAPPRDWLNAYPNATFRVITPQNYQELVLPPSPPAP